MHNNYYFLRQLSSHLHILLQGYSIVSCFSQNKEELVIELNNSTQSFFIKASLHAHFSCLSFPAQFSRARKNSIDLFADTILQKVTGVYQFSNERSFALLLENGLQLIFKMHGNRSNVLLADSTEVKELFKNQLKGDADIIISSLDRTIDWSKEAFLANHHEFARHYFTFGKEVAHYLHDKGFEQADAEQRWNLFQDVIRLLSKPEFYISAQERTVTFSLLPPAIETERFNDPVKAINEFFYRYTAIESFSSEKYDALKLLKEQLTSSRHYISKNQQKLNEIQNDHRYQAWGDLIMANMHNIRQGDDKAVVEDFYNENKPIEIKLKKDISPQKNAEVFYRKGKNQQIEIDKLKEVIAKKEKEIRRIEATMAEVDGTTGLKDFRKKADAAGLTAAQRAKETAPLPFHEFEYHGYKIWVGRNAEKNDELTLKYAYKEDLWLHAKDVAGSHVIIKHQSGKKTPKDVITRAAELAAYNSKRKTETLCPVIVTPKKFVRKRKGDPAGAMVVEKEEIVMVEPRLEAEWK